MDYIVYTDNKDELIRVCRILDNDLISIVCNNDVYCVWRYNGTYYEVDNLTKIEALEVFKECLCKENYWII
ncbi:hypothetical protein D3C85_1916890 [compost metagenome]